MPAWNKRRAARVRRRADGTIREWTGGRTKASLPKKENTQQGIATHIGQGFRSQNGRNARTGDVFRWKRSDGKYHAGAYWYIRTAKGWRKSPTATTKPSAAVIRRVCANARTGRQNPAGPG